ITYDMKITNEEVNVSGDQAVARGTYAATITPKDGSEPITIDGKYMTLLKRQPDGTWKIYRDIFNSNVPPAAPAADDVEAVTAAVNKVWDQYASSLNAGDVDRYMALWADDAMQLPPDSLPLVGKDTLRAGLESEVKEITYDMKITNEEVNASGDMAVARGTYAATITPKDGSEPITIDGKYMTLLKRQSDGSWKIFRDIYNSNVPPAADDQASLSPEPMIIDESAIIGIH
ncbi:MAG: SgcJ/EcaC family oxidoreductase, partial [Anaerolineae bacterium]|nr:SgcJ/EcaC family oxidoreductase [Anaerolineae bacterium]